MGIKGGYRKWFYNDVEAQRHYFSFQNFWKAKKHEILTKAGENMTRAIENSKDRRRIRRADLQKAWSIKERRRIRRAELRKARRIKQIALLD